MGVVQNYNVGGWIDEIKKINFPPHLFPSLSTPFTKGFTIPVPAVPGTYQLSYTLPEDMELVNVAVACSGYKDGDTWEVSVEEPGKPAYKIVETMPTRELAESINMGNVLYIVLRLPAGTIIRFDFINSSGTSKNVWPSIRLLRK